MELDSMPTKSDQLCLRLSCSEKLRTKKGIFADSVLQPALSRINAFNLYPIPKIESSLQFCRKSVFDCDAASHLDCLEPARSSRGFAFCEDARCVRNGREFSADIPCGSAGS